jgi:uncharacterized membrane protein
MSHQREFRLCCLTGSRFADKSPLVSTSFALFLALCIGIVAGMRSMTAPAVTAWGAHGHWLKLAGTPLNFLGSLAAVIIFVLLAVGELVADKLPNTPARTQPPGLIARLLTGALCGAALGATIGVSLLPGALLGASGGIVGAFAGYQWRTGLVRALRVPDYVIALSEDAIAIAAGLYIVSRF